MTPTNSGAMGSHFPLMNNGKKKMHRISSVNVFGLIVALEELILAHKTRIISSRRGRDEARVLTMPVSQYILQPGYSVTVS